MPDTALSDAFQQARAVADAVLYEGCLLYPYRADAAKNQLRWQFGVLVPPPTRTTPWASTPGPRPSCWSSPAPTPACTGACASSRPSAAPSKPTSATATTRCPPQRSTA
ncbi:hypothetical protein ACFQZ4_10190 [Catellatospora coxensis]